MYSKSEQRLLLELLKAKQTATPLKTNGSYWFKTVKLLEEGDHLKVISTHPNQYELSTFGECMASMIAKHPKTNPKWLKYAKTVEMYLLEKGVFL